MPRKPSEVFTDKELEIMNVIWKVGEATVKDIQEQLPDEPHYNSVLTIIRVLERKGHLVHRAEGKTYYYSAGENKEKARVRLLRHMIDQVFGGSASSVVLNLVQAGDLTKKISTKSAPRSPNLTSRKRRKTMQLNSIDQIVSFSGSTIRWLFTWSWQSFILLAVAWLAVKINASCGATIRYNDLADCRDRGDNIARYQRSFCALKSTQRAFTS